MIHSVCLEVLKADRLIKTHTRHTDSCTHAALADLMQCSAWGSPAVCAWLAGCQWVRWEGLGRDSPSNVFTRCTVASGEHCSWLCKAPAVGLDPSPSWQDRLVRPRLAFRHPLCVQALCPGELTPGYCFAVCAVVELFKVAKGGQTQTSHR